MLKLDHENSVNENLGSVVKDFFEFIGYNRPVYLFRVRPQGPVVGYTVVVVSGSYTCFYEGLLRTEVTSLVWVKNSKESIPGSET